MLFQWDWGPCECGCAFFAHRHYRSGVECALCTKGCPRYRPAWWNTAGAVVCVLLVMVITLAVTF